MISLKLIVNDFDEFVFFYYSFSLCYLINISGKINVFENNFYLNKILHLYSFGLSNLPLRRNFSKYFA